MLPKYGLLFFVLFILQLFNSSCNQPYFELSYSIGDIGWYGKDSIAFVFEVVDTQKTYDIFLDIEHDNDFEYENFNVMIQSYAPSGLAQQQVQSINLSSGKGIWFGDCNTETCLLSLPFITRSHFNEPGEYKIVFRQYNRFDPLQGLRKMSLYMYEHKQK